MGSSEAGLTSLSFPFCMKELIMGTDQTPLGKAQGEPGLHASQAPSFRSSPSFCEWLIFSTFVMTADTVTDFNV